MEDLNPALLPALASIVGSCVVRTFKFEWIVDELRPQCRKSSDAPF
jgi:hypothetical protein